jgi:hypothetical protein
MYDGNGSGAIVLLESVSLPGFGLFALLFVASGSPFVTNGAGLGAGFWSFFCGLRFALAHMSGIAEAVSNVNLRILSVRYILFPRHAIGSWVESKGVRSVRDTDYNTGGVCFLYL